MNIVRFKNGNRCIGYLGSIHLNLTYYIQVRHCSCAVAYLECSPFRLSRMLRAVSSNSGLDRPTSKQVLTTLLPDT